VYVVELVNIEAIILTIFDVCDSEICGPYLNFPIFVLLLALTLSSEINNFFVSLVPIFLIVARTDVLHSMSSKRDQLHLMVVKGVTTVTIWAVFWDECGRIFTSGKIFVADNRSFKSKIVRHTLYYILLNGLIHQIHCFFAVFAPGDQFANHWIIVHINLTSLLHTSINSDVGVKLRFEVL
jgi:hypothetical protein